MTVYMPQCPPPYFVRQSSFVSRRSCNMLNRFKSIARKKDAESSIAQIVGRCFVMSESFYTSSPSAGIPTGTPALAPVSPISSAPPPPPPKPLSQSADPSRSGTPIHSSLPGAAPSSLPAQGSISTNSPRPQPPLPTSLPSSSTPVPQAAQQYPQHTPIPPPALQERWLPEQVADKPINELQTLLNNQSLLASLAATHPSYSSSLVPLQNAIQANVHLAQQVSQAESQLRKLRDETAQLLLNHTSLQTQWRRKQSEMDDALSPWGPRQMYQRLLSSINEQESLLKAMQESFLEGTNDDAYNGGHGKASEKEVTEWVRRIREGATTLEKRREMRARWDEGRVGGWR